MRPGRLVLTNGPRAAMRAFNQELAHHALHRQEGAVLWCDGEHGFNPYDFAEVNLARGYDAEWGADRMLVKRCMTPFQWDTVLSKHLDQKLVETDTGLVLVAPYDALFSTDELKDWEQEDYVRHSVGHLRDLARAHRVPILLSVDMARWWRTHPILARTTYESVDDRWTVTPSGQSWRLVHGTGDQVLGPRTDRQTTIWDFVAETPPTVRAVRSAVLAAGPAPA
jgi:hypothetical protein